VFSGCFSRKDNVLALWQLLLELLRSRRRRLELSHELQKTFQEMLYILDWMDEIKVSYCFVTIGRWMRLRSAIALLLLAMDEIKVSYCFVTIGRWMRSRSAIDLLLLADG